MPEAPVVVVPGASLQPRRSSPRPRARSRRVSIEREGGDVVLVDARPRPHPRARSGRPDRDCRGRRAPLRARRSGSPRPARCSRSTRRATRPVGACLAGDLSGPRRHRYGAPRDLVLGVTVVLADGTVASSGGKVVKNVAGYDLGKLFCGSRGRFGLIARAALRLHPRPAARGDARRAARPSPSEAYRLVAACPPLAAVPSAVDLLWRGSGSRLALLFEGSERAVDDQLRAAQRAPRRRARGLVGLGGVARLADANPGADLLLHRAASRRRSACMAEALVRPPWGRRYVMEPSADGLGARGPAAGGARCEPRSIRAVCSHRSLWSWKIKTL